MMNHILGSDANLKAPEEMKKLVAFDSDLKKAQQVIAAKMQKRLEQDINQCQTLSASDKTDSWEILTSTKLKDPCLASLRQKYYDDEKTLMAIYYVDDVMNSPKGNFDITSPNIPAMDLVNRIREMAQEHFAPAAAAGVAPAKPGSPGTTGN